MDWYYPVLGGAVRGRAAYELLESRWDEFVVPGLGIRCVDTNPWVTGAETCELAMALDTIGDHRRALTLLEDMQHLRESTTAATGPAGSTTTGHKPDGEPRDVYWPVEHTTYTAAAVILAVDALGEVAGHSTAGSGIMRGTSLARTSASSPSSAAAQRERVAGLARAFVVAPASSPAPRPPRSCRPRARAGRRGTAAARRPPGRGTRRGSPARRRS